MIAMPMHERALEAGATIYSEGEPGDAVYFIRSGQVEILKLAGATPVRLVTLGKGEVLGEMSVIRDEARSTTARAITPTELMVLTKDDFIEAFGGKNGIALSILRMLCERLAQTNQQLLADSKVNAEPDEPALLSEVAAIRLDSGSELVRLPSAYPTNPGREINHLTL
ncbi:MAG: cyclic nucleotide-binding domain-containing protein [Alphaproteobacteria bacterium]|nr:cyclic nucleotide-binding domain-containing protein [Alphaproteobacteria bacterium]